jgi:hypothetical protein
MEKNVTDSSKTLEELEGQNWGEPTYDSYLVKTIHRLRRKPIGEFTVEDLRIALGQQLGMEHLTVLALDHLEIDPLAEGDFYPGDLLKAVMSLPRSYWLTHPGQATRMQRIADRAARLLDERDVTEEIKTALRSHISAQSWHIA